MRRLPPPRRGRRGSEGLGAVVSSDSYLLSTTPLPSNRCRDTSSSAEVGFDEALAAKFPEAVLSFEAASQFLPPQTSNCPCLTELDRSDTLRPSATASACRRRDEEDGPPETGSTNSFPENFRVCLFSSAECVDWQALRRAQLKRRKEISLLRAPLQTLSYFALGASAFAFRALRGLAARAELLWLCVAAAIAVLALHVEGPHAGPLREAWICAQLAVWWVGLGVLSSVGLGSGMHSGLLFLFPHIFAICASAEECQSLDFDARTSMWGGVLRPGERFACNGEPQGPPGFLALFWKALPYALLWGFGTALGELPPYAASYAAAKGQEADAEFEELEGEVQGGGTSLVVAMKAWTLELVRRYGALSVFLLSCWPNVLFDLCGVVCGHFLMPFGEFFIALVLGKAVVKASAQAAFLVFIFSSQFDATRAHAVAAAAGIWPIEPLVNRFFGSPKQLEERIALELAKLRHGQALSSSLGETSSSLSSSSWGWFRHISISGIFSAVVAVLLLLFFLSCVEQFAQMYRRKLDDKLVERLREGLESLRSADDEAATSVARDIAPEFEAGSSGGTSTSTRGRRRRQANARRSRS